MIKYSYIFSVLIFACQFLNSQTPQAQWGVAIGDGESGLSKVNDLVIDTEGNTYVVGTFRRLLDVDPGDQTYLLSGNNTDDLWMAAYSPQYELLWANKIANSNTENIASIHLNQNDELLICGFFTNTLDFDPGPGVTELTTFSASNSDGYFASYSTSGALNWVKQIGGNSVDNVQDIITDQEGNIIITGNFSQTADLDPSAAVSELTATGSFNDLFLAKYTSTGNYIWSFSLEGSNFPDNGQALGILSNNSIVLGAIYQGDIDADPGPGIAPIEHANNYDALIACYTSEGNYVWAGKYGFNGDDRVNSIAIDDSDNIYVGGYFNQTVDFDFGPSTNQVTSAGNDDACLLSYDAAGNLRWARTWGSSSADEIQGIAISNNGKIAVTGGFNGTVDFNPGIENDELTALGTDAFLAIYDQNGNYERVIGLGGTSFDFGNSVYFLGEVVTIGGLFDEIVDFDPGVTVAQGSVVTQSPFFASYSANTLQLNQLAAFQDRKGGNDNVLGMTHDIDGNIYVCGSFEGSAFFAESGDEFPAVDELDAFVAKYSPSGVPLMILTFGGDGNDLARDVKVDSHGNIYVVGSFEANLDADPGMGEFILNSAGNTDAFLIKLNSSGNLIWANAIGGGAEDNCFALDLNSNEDVFITGHFRATVDFDNGPNELIFSAAVRDCYIAGYNASQGSLIWAKQISGSSSEYGSFIACDQNDAIIAGGYFASTIDADPGPNVFSLTSNGSNDAFVVKLDPLGNFEWAFSVGGSSSDQFSSIQINNNNEFYLGGYYQNSIDLDPGVAEQIVVSEGQTDIFIMKFLNEIDTQSGLPTLSWAHSFGSIGSDFLFDLNITGNEIYFTGTMADTINFDVNENANGIIGSPFSSQGYYVKLNEDASFNEAYLFNGSGQTFIYSIEATQSGLYLSGQIGGDLDIQPGPAENILPGIGENDGMIFKLGEGEPCEPSFSVLTETSCESFTLNSQVFNQSGQYSQTIVNSFGCDSLITLNLTILDATSASLDEEACGTFTLNGQNYSQSGQYTQTLVNTASCDSIITLNLSILNATSASLNEVACGSFTLNGQNYSESGQYTQTLINTAGCDSTITLNLNISQLENISISENGNILTASLENSIYQWINCTSNEIIKGETNQVYEASSPGSYAVIVTEGACADTSECVLLTTVNNTTLDMQGLVSLVPNPASHFIDIQLDERMRASEIKIYAADGKLCFKDNNIQNLVTRVALNNWNEGLYFIIIQSQKSLVSEKFIITK
jgi:hypothetical protein